MRIKEYNNFKRRCALLSISILACAQIACGFILISGDGVGENQNNISSIEIVKAQQENMEIVKNQRKEYYGKEHYNGILL